MHQERTKKLVRAAVIAGAYVALVVLFAPLSFGPWQFRVAEALSLLPFLWDEAIAGLFIGCLLANFMGGFGLIDVVFGSVSTLIAAFLSSRMPNPYLAALPPIFVNGLIVGLYLSMLTGLHWWMSMIYVATGEAGVCVVLGIPLCLLLRRVFHDHKELKTG